MRPSSISLVCGLATACASAASRPAPPSPLASPTVPLRAPGHLDDFVRVRCATDGSDVFTTWRGHLYAFVPGEAPRHLFDLVGMNVARCGREPDGWYLTSRELLYYLDPESGAIVDRWVNPWTAQTVPVVHVANGSVQARFREPPEASLAGGLATYAIDVPLFYPNRLAADPALAAYSPQPGYQAGEFFTLTAPTAQVVDATRAGVTDLMIGWHRVGPWLPWMAMGERPGLLVYSAAGRKATGVADLPELVRADIAARLPRYARAPACYLAAKNETSWSYFARHLAAYQAGERFPLPAPVVDEPCAEGAAK